MEKNRERSTSEKQWKLEYLGHKMSNEHRYNAHTKGYKGRNGQERRRSILATQSSKMVESF